MTRFLFWELSYKHFIHAYWHFICVSCWHSLLCPGLPDLHNENKPQCLFKQEHCRHGNRCLCLTSVSALERAIMSTLRLILNFSSAVKKILINQTEKSLHYFSNIDMDWYEWIYKITGLLGLRHKVIWLHNACYF